MTTKSDAPSILFINQHYWPDFASTAQHLTDLAEYLVREGFQVHILCSRGHYLSGSLEVPTREVHNGVHIYRVPATAFGRGTVAGRLLDYATFYTSTLAHTLFRKQFDLVVTLTTPPLLPILGAILKRLRGQRYGIWSMDLHPDAEVAAGMFDEGDAATQALHVINNYGYRNAAFVVDLGPLHERADTIKRSG